MKFSRDVGFAIINRNTKIDKNLPRIFKKAFSVNKSIFKKSPKKFKIVICDSEEDFKKEAKYYYQKWSAATVLRDCTLVTRSPEFAKREFQTDAKYFQMLMNHEMCHVFWQSFYSCTNPIWLDEGLACHIGNHFILSGKELKQMVGKYNVTTAILDYRYLKRKFDKGHIPNYPIWATFTRWLAEKYSVEKLVQLMEIYSRNQTKTNYEVVFKKIFGKSDKSMFKQFLKEYVWI